jgi:phage gpG-like protein
MATLMATLIKSFGTGYVPRDARIAMDIQIDPAPMLMMRKFDGLAKDVRSFREPLKRAIQKVMAPSFQKNFDVGGRVPPNGAKWVPLSAFTVKMKGHAQPLVRSGKLRRVAGQLNIWTIQGQGQEGRAFISGLPARTWYGIMHQSGAFGAARLGQLKPRTLTIGDALPGEVPARPFFVVQKEDYEKVGEIFEDWVDERRRRHTL